MKALLMCSLAWALLVSAAWVIYTAPLQVLAVGVVVYVVVKTL